MKLTQPSLDDDELVAIGEVLSSGNLTQGTRAVEFENLIAGYVGAPHAVATSSCTTALHLCLDALGIGPGDEVIVPDFTFPATGNVVVQIGATPVLVDIDPISYCLDPDRLEASISNKTRAVIPVHAFGLCADMDPILRIADSKAIAVVEDAACALGATYKGRYSGTLGRVSCFSFHPRKVITTGEGGMITTGDFDLFTRMKALASHGGIRGEHYMSFSEAGYNYRLSDVHAAIGIAQMTKLEGILESRRRLAGFYSEMLEVVPGVRPPIEPQGRRHTFQSFVVMLDEGIDRDLLIASLKKAGIETTLGTYALHMQPFYQSRFNYKAGQFPISERAFRQALTLPLFPSMSYSDVEFVVESLKREISRL